jgi:hypothetical protein
MSSNLVSLPRSRNHLSPEPYHQISSDSWASAAAFERFLNWLGPDEEKAGLQYESIRSRLIMMFKARRCVFAEDLADATIERVARKLSDLTFRFYGDPALYFYGVAKKIYLEYQRKIIADYRRVAFSPSMDPVNPDLENMLNQLDEALSTIPKFDRDLILRYYGGSGKNKVNHRRALAQQLGIGLNTLRLRVFRIRRK